jgi:hypothetical protein
MFFLNLIVTPKSRVKYELWVESYGRNIVDLQEMSFGNMCFTF